LRTKDGCLLFAGNGAIRIFDGMKSNATRQFVFKKMSFPETNDAAGKFEFLREFCLRYVVGLPGGFTLDFSISKTFEMGYKAIEGAVFDSGGAECGRVDGKYFLKGDLASWDEDGDAVVLWEQMEESRCRHVINSMLHTQLPLNKSLYISRVKVDSRMSGRKVGVNAMRALFDFVRTQYHAKSMVATMMPLQHLDEGVNYGRAKMDIAADTQSLANYLAQEISLTFFGENCWLHYDGQGIEKTWRPEARRAKSENACF